AYAQNNYRKAHQARPRQPAVALRLAQVDVRLGDFAEARDRLDDLRRRGYRRPEVLLCLAQCRIRQDDPAGGRALLDELLAEAPDEYGGLLERGKLALEEGDRDGAERWLRRAVELSPQDRVALNFLIQALSQQGKTAESNEAAARLRHIEEEQKQLE